jgi:hypothetical protein
MEINFKLPANIIKNLNNKYTIDELQIIAKNLFLDWYEYKNKNMNDYETYQIKESIQQLQQVTKDIFGYSKISQKRGEIGENMIYQIFQNDFQNYSFEKTNHMSHSADAIIITPNNDKFLLEIKNYQTVVDQKEIDKLKYDMEYTDINYALFISIQSGIVGKKTIDIEKFIKNDIENTIVYVTYIFEETHKLHTSITLIESLIKAKKYNYNIIKDDIIETIKEITDIYDTIKKLNSQFLSVENNIKEQLSSFYIIIREYQLKIKEKINKISNKLDNTNYLVNEDFLNNFTENECNLHILKINDFLIEKNIKLLIKDDSSWYLLNNENNIGEIKKFKSKIEISIYNPNICIKFLPKNKSEDNYKLLNTIFTN